MFPIGSAFWGLIFGVAVSWLKERTILRKASPDAKIRTRIIHGTARTDDWKPEVLRNG
jgi:hypothetical protein